MYEIFTAKGMKNRNKPKMELISEKYFLIIYSLQHLEKNVYGVK